ncbi:MAG TPA: DnaB-like helicase N-terminal domain-containing protein, partial [Allocoleopsis sp.]
MNNNILPHNIDAEEAVLGAILLDPEAIGIVEKILIPDAFYVSAHKKIYETCVQLYRTGKTTDLMTVTTRLLDKNNLEDVGGQFKLAQLVERTVSSVNIDLYAKYVNEQYVTRKSILLLGNMRDQMFNSLNIEEVEMNLKSALKEVGYLVNVSSKTSLSRDQILANRLKEIYAMENEFEKKRAFKALEKETEFSEKELIQLAFAVENQKPLVSYTAKEICNMKLPGSKWLFDGFIPGGAVSILVAESKAGKSLLSYDIAYHACNGKPWGEFPIEKPVKTLILQSDEPI